MRMISILQPGYLPWLGYFDQMARADFFVHYDDVQYDKNGWRNRNRIKTPQGPQWLTVPVLVSGKQFPPICEVRIDSRAAWQKKHMRSIAQSYTKAPHFVEYAPELFELLEQPWDLLVDLDLAVIEWLKEKLGITTPTVRSSQMKADGQRVERLIAIVKELGGDAFYEGAAGRNYIDPRQFEEAGIRIVFQEYGHPYYKQLHGDFVPYMSTLDLLLNHGADSLDIILGRTQA